MKRSHSLTRSELFLAYDRTLIQPAKEMRKNPTPAEKKLWDDYLSTFPHRILRQRPIDHFIVDFFCAALRLVIEVDGEIHNLEQSQVRDDMRSKILHSYGLQVVPRSPYYEKAWTLNNPSIESSPLRPSRMDQFNAN
jgi:very-short-patch-repair endonuclease